MRAYELASGAGIEGLRHVDRPCRPLGDREVRIRIDAVALNYRDLMFADGEYGVPIGDVVIPLTDGAGEVIAAGPAVTRVRTGDRIIANFWPDWIDGDATPELTAVQYGAQIDGTLAEHLVAHEDALVVIPSGLSSRTAAAIPCAGLTAWHALFVEGAQKPGNTVLLIGTGGVSIWALQLASAAGLRPIVTSSSDEKLARAAALGAIGTINYRTTPEWQDEVRRLTGGRGVDLALDTGGADTIRRSIAAVRMGGTVVVVSSRGGGGASVDHAVLIAGTKRLAGIMVGSRAMLTAGRIGNSHATK